MLKFAPEARPCVIVGELLKGVVSFVVCRVCANLCVPVVGRRRCFARDSCDRFKTVAMWYAQCLDHKFLSGGVREFVVSCHCRDIRVFVRVPSIAGVDCSSSVRFIIPQVPTVGFGASGSLSPQNACVVSRWRAGAHPRAARMSRRMLVSNISAVSLASRFLASAKLWHSRRTCLVVPLVSSQNGHVSLCCCPDLKALAGLQRLSDRQVRMRCAFGCCLPMLLSCW